MLWFLKQSFEIPKIASVPVLFVIAVIVHDPLFQVKF